jgi:hypothetical protein
VLKTIFGSPLDPKAAPERSSEVATEWGGNLDRLKSLLEYFPIGKMLRYCPEFKKEIVFDTLVVAYCVNGDFLYSAEAIDRDSDGNPTFFRAGENGQRTPVSGVKQFQLLVPDTSELEMKLDYHRRALIGRGRQFIKGNFITLISNAAGRGVTTVDTEVAKPISLQNGPYAHTKMILLTPELNSLTVTDQRKKVRAKTSVPVMVTLLGETLSESSTIVDISDGAVRIRVRDNDPAMPELHQSDEVILVVNLGEAERHYTIKGTILRRLPEICVVKLEGLFKNGKFANFTLLDFLELKAGLLNYGA